MASARLPGPLSRGLLYGPRGREGRSPRLGAPTVFENSTACAILKGLFGALPDRVQARPSPVPRDWAAAYESTRQVGVGSRCTFAGHYRFDSFPEDSGTRPRAGLIPRRFFTESLILAQDERWRRA